VHRLSESALEQPPKHQQREACEPEGSVHIKPIGIQGGADYNGGPRDPSRDLLVQMNERS
jgi:hypothetical protein